MAELKTKKTEQSVESFLKTIADEQKQKDAFELVKGENDLNQFIELRVNAVPEKNNSNTIPFKD